MSNSHETAELLKKSLKIVDKLAKIDINDIRHDEDSADELEDLIEKAKKITKHRLFVLK